MKTGSKYVIASHTKLVITVLYKRAEMYNYMGLKIVAQKAEVQNQRGWTGDPVYCL